MVDNGLKENDHEIQMGLMMIMKMIMMMMMIRLMVDFGPFFVDSATRKCGLKDHGVDFETWSRLSDLRQSRLEDLLWT